MYKKFSSEYFWIEIYFARLSIFEQLFWACYQLNEKNGKHKKCSKLSLGYFLFEHYFHVSLSSWDYVEKLIFETY